VNGDARVVQAPRVHVLRDVKAVAILLVAGACTAAVGSYEDEGATSGASVALTSHLSGCHGQASSAIPANDKYVLTTFGEPGDEQPMSCGGEANGTGWYAASRQRYGCGGRVKVCANAKCAVVATKDYGPDVCVEAAAGMPILDASPQVAKLLFGTSEEGWSDRAVVVVTEVDASTPLGPFTDTGTSGGTGSGSAGSGSTSTGAPCNSATLGREVDEGTCVQSASDADWYQCEAGAWVARGSVSSCTESYGYCDSATLGRSVPAGTCVQSASSGSWFQCNGQEWVTPVDTAAESGPIGDCSSWNAR
jgi:hypothetical protein